MHVPDARMCVRSTVRDRESLGEVKRKKLQTHFILYIRETSREVDGEHDEDDVALRVAQRSEAVVLLLARGVPQRELDELPVERDLRDVVLEHGGDVRLKQQAKLRTTIADPLSQQRACAGEERSRVPPESGSRRTR